jgi:hypothetical protein
MKKVSIFPKPIYGFYVLRLTMEFAILTPDHFYLYVDRPKEKTKGWVKFNFSGRGKHTADRIQILNAIFASGVKVGEL